jgi:hypothetical protein
VVSFPPRLEWITAVIQLVCVIVIYQLYRNATKKVASRNIIVLAVVSGLALLTYLWLLSESAFFVRSLNRYIVVGYECLPRALQAHSDQCPRLNLHILAGALYQEAELWSSRSLTIMRLSVVSVWFIFFGCLSGVIAQFLVFEKRASDARQRRLR